MGVNDWPEQGVVDFRILDVKEGETFDAAIERARSHYSPSLECYIVDEHGRRVYG